jgi:hypothetical protein
MASCGTSLTMPAPVDRNQADQMKRLALMSPDVAKLIAIESEGSSEP